MGTSAWDVRMRGMCMLLTIVVLALRCSAQCIDPGWITSGSVPGAGAGGVNAMTWWDPDGPGPTPRRVVAVGDFTAIGSQPIAKAAIYDVEQDTWSQLGPPGGLTGSVNAVAVLPNNHLLLGGQMKLGTTPVILVEWDGEQWSAFADQNVVPNIHITYSKVLLLSTLPTGQIFVAGQFYTSDVYLYKVNKWSGSGWGVAQTRYVLLGNEVAPTGLVPIDGDTVLIAEKQRAYAPGGLSNSASSCLNRITANDLFTISPPLTIPGYTWSGLNSLKRHPDGTIYACGNFAYRATPGSSTLSYGGLARYNGVSCEVVPSPPQTYAMVDILDNGDMLLARYADNQRTILSLYNGQSYTDLATPIFGTAKCQIELPGGDILIGGRFDVPGAGPLVNLVRYQRSNNTWRSAVPGTVGQVRTLVLDPAGNLLVGGDFVAIEGYATRGIARRSRNTGSWSDIGGGITSAPVYRYLEGPFNPRVSSISANQRGYIYVGGEQRSGGGANGNGLWIWNGTDWSETASIPHTTPWNPSSFYIQEVSALTCLPNGLLLGVRTGRIVTEVLMLDDVGIWHRANCPNTMTYGGCPDSAVLSARVCISLSNNRYLVAGSYAVGYWNGAAWTDYRSVYGGVEYGYIQDGTILPDGSVVIVGDLRVPCPGCTPNITQVGILRFDGTTWSVYGSPNGIGTAPYYPNSVAARQNGEVIVGGPGFLKHWNGTQWRSLASNIDGTVYALQVLPDGDLAVGGDFTTIDGVVRPSFAIYRFGCGSCPADIGTQGGIAGHDGLLDNNDFFVFLNSFFEADPTVDIGAAGGAPGPDGEFDFNDFLVFIDRFFAGCS